MKTPEIIVQLLGGLHDAVVCKFDWRPESRTVELTIDDFWSNFEGLPEYQGPLSGLLTFKGVSSLEADFEALEERLNIYDLVLTRRSSLSIVAVFAFWPSGRMIIDGSEITFPTELSMMPGGIN